VGPGGRPGHAARRPPSPPLLRGRAAHAELDEILAAPEMHFFADAEDARHRWQRDTTVANVALVTAGVLAAGAVTLAIVGRPAAPRSVAVLPWLDGHGGVGLSGVVSLR